MFKKLFASKKNSDCCNTSFTEVPAENKDCCQVEIKEVLEDGKECCS